MNDIELTRRVEFSRREHWIKLGDMLLAVSTE
jgi:hypothetical protein